MFSWVSPCVGRCHRPNLRPARHGLADAEGRILTVPITGIAPRCQEVGCKTHGKQAWNPRTKNGFFSENVLNLLHFWTLEQALILST